MKKLLLIIIFTFWSFFAFANDSAIDGVGETLRLIKGEHNNIQMVSEKIKMNIYENYYDVEAIFTFKNLSNKKQKVKMGFPENGMGDIFNKNPQNHSSFLTFSTFVDDKKTKVNREVVSISEEGFYKFYWIKEVDFEANKTCNVKVVYRAKMGHGVGDELRSRAFVEYNFTGGNWKNKVAKSSLIAVSHLPKYYINFIEASSKEIKIKGNSFFYEKKQWEAEDTFFLSFLVPNSKHSNLIDTDNLFGKFPETASKELLLNDIKKLSCKDLWIMRNEIFARYGKQFQDKEVKDYFKSQSWYKISQNYNDNMLNEIESKNIKIILSEEKNRKCF